MPRLSGFKEELVPVLLILGVACGEPTSGATEDTDDVTGEASTMSCQTAECATTSEQGTGTEATSEGSGDGTTSAPGTSSTATTEDGETSSDETASGTPLACPFTPGCHQPGPHPQHIGLASEVPLGCDGGAFGAAWSVAVGGSGLADPEAPRSIPMLADFDADGALDLFLNMRKAGAAYVLRGPGDGTFDLAAPAVLTGGLFSGGWGGDVGDFNRDGALDVLVGDHVRGAWAWTGGPGLMFAKAEAGLPQSFLYSGGGLADFNGDGFLDALFGADQFNKGYTLARGDGAGGWTEWMAPMSATATNVGHFQFADYDGDDQIDIFAFGKGGGAGITAYVYHNDGIGNFSEVAVLPAGPANPGTADPVQGSIGDVNCDGQVDIAAGGTIFTGQAGLWSLAAVVDDAHISHLADMNGDGQLDLVSQDPAFGLAVHVNDGTGAGWTPAGAGLPDAAYRFQGVEMDTAYGIDVGDVDGDDVLDIVRVAGFGSEYAVEVFVR
jgi:hypothetical protein